MKEKLVASKSKLVGGELVNKTKLSPIYTLEALAMDEFLNEIQTSQTQVKSSEPGKRIIRFAAIEIVIKHGPEIGKACEYKKRYSKVVYRVFLYLHFRFFHKKMSCLEYYTEF